MSSGLDLGQIFQQLLKSPKYSSAILYYVFMQNGVLGSDDCKIKILIKSEEH